MLLLCSCITLTLTVLHAVPPIGRFAPYAFLFHVNSCPPSQQWPGIPCDTLHECFQGIVSRCYLRIDQHLADRWLPTLMQLCTWAHMWAWTWERTHARTHAQQHIPDEARVGENCSMCTIWGRGAPRGPERGWDRNTIGATPSPPKWCTLWEDGSRRGDAAALCVCCLSVDHRALVVQWNTQTRARAHTGNSRSLGPGTWPTHSGAL